MARQISGILLGLVVAFILLMVLEGAIGFLVLVEPTQPGQPVSPGAYLGSTKAMVLLVFSYAVASFAGGYVEGRVARTPALWPTSVLALLLAAAGLANFYALPGHPAWVVAASLLAFFVLPFAGRRVAYKLPDADNMIS